MGEEICAWVKLKENSEGEKVTAEDIKNYCKDKVNFGSNDQINTKWLKEETI
jgi:hypothetical protein